MLSCKGYRCDSRLTIPLTRFRERADLRKRPVQFLKIADGSLPVSLCGWKRQAARQNTKKDLRGLAFSRFRVGK